MNVIGELMAIMGPSGSGKTTLLNVLAHREPTPSATVTQTLAINGLPTSLKNFQKLSSYVEQQDALVGSLTVRETLYFAAKLSLPR
jgi:ABC-type multidrug transport system ATPase subunit